MSDRKNLKTKKYNKRMMQDFDNFAKIIKKGKKRYNCIENMEENSYLYQRIKELRCTLLSKILVLRKIQEVM